MENGLSTNPMQDSGGAGRQVSSYFSFLRPMVGTAHAAVACVLPFHCFTNREKGEARSHSRSQRPYPECSELPPPAPGAPHCWSTLQWAQAPGPPRGAETPPPRMVPGPGWSIERKNRIYETRRRDASQYHGLLTSPEPPGTGMPRPPPGTSRARK